MKLKKTQSELRAMNRLAKSQMREHLVSRAKDVLTEFVTEKDNVDKAHNQIVAIMRAFEQITIGSIQFRKMPPEQALAAVPEAAIEAKPAEGV